MTPSKVKQKIAEYAESLGMEELDVFLQPSMTLGSGVVLITAETSKGKAWAQHVYESDSPAERTIARAALKAGRRAADMLHAEVSTKH